MKSIWCSAAGCVLVFTLAGCPQQSADTAGPAVLDVLASAPASAKASDEIPLTASIVNAADPGASYVWYQVFGRSVELSDSTSASPRFAAPSVAGDQELRFRVDVRTPGGGMGSAEVTVRVEADPNFGFNATPAGAPGASDNDPKPRVRIITSKGTILLELDRATAPLTVNNFLRYVTDGHYDGTIFHRVIPDFVIQGGGFEPGLVEKDTRPPIINEGNNGVKNARGTIAMARTTDPDSARAQFFINTVDNDSLDYRPDQPGYAVFGRVIDGMTVVDDIAAVETGTQSTPQGQPFQDVPVEDVTIDKVERVDTP